MEPKTLATSILVEDLEKYLALDHNGEKLMEAFCLNHPSNRPAIVPVKEEEEESLLKTRSQLEITLLTWLSVVSPTYKQNYGIRSENLELVYKIGNDEIHADIEDGVYYFTKDHFYNSDQKEDESLVFAIIYPGHEHYQSFTDELKMQATECLEIPKNPNPQKTFGKIE